MVDASLGASFGIMKKVGKLIRISYFVLTSEYPAGGLFILT